MLDRRQLLILAALVSCRLAAPRVGAALPNATTELADLVRAIDTAALRSVGQKYLAQKPEENHLAWLEQTLTTRDGERLEVALDQAIRADFREGRMVRLDQWFLSVTECRVCALLSTVATR